MKKPEILSPAGSPEKARFAFAYGADAVYAAGENFGLRSSAGNFTNNELEKAVSEAKTLGKKIYVAANVFPYNSDIEPMKAYFDLLARIKPDAVILSDLGAMSVLKERAPRIPFHVSVQANNLNYREVLEWGRLGAKRIILARELPFEEIKKIRKEAPDMELEIFVHGSICMSFSGRCLLSNYMTGRDSNRGKCAQSCRWSYRLEEEKRPGEYMPVVEDNRGTYIFNSKDLCCAPVLERFIELGIDSFKIEGRMKSTHYAAVTAGVYSRIRDEYMKDPAGYRFNPVWYEELLKISHREYTNGLYFQGERINQDYTSSDYRASYKYCGYVKAHGDKNIYSVQLKATLKTGEYVEVLTSDYRIFEAKVTAVLNADNTEATHNKQFGTYTLKLDAPEVLPELSILRVKQQGK
ncbi:MAG: U32 family peptidase [Spirochaetia bacterium]|nr:U32 family peptidase [Spirochaetia bacterium]